MLYGGVGLKTDLENEAACHDPFLYLTANLHIPAFSAFQCWTEQTEPSIFKPPTWEGKSDCTAWTLELPEWELCVNTNGIRHRGQGSGLLEEMTGEQIGPDYFVIPYKNALITENKRSIFLAKKKNTVSKYEQIASQLLNTHN